jgi:hypothetical protein
MRQSHVGAWLLPPKIRLADDDGILTIILI